MLTLAKRWRLVPHDAAAIDRLGRALRVSPVIAQLLLNRGLEEADAAQQFLNAPLTDLHPPARLPGAVEAAQRLHRAALDGRRICVFGDYDVDGVSGTAILWQALRRLGASVDYYVPHRLDEGYGLNGRALRQLAQTGTSVVVTVDCGITALEEADEARRLGLELMVTDHHALRSELPQAAVLVHPRLPGQPYPFGGLSGAGVAFKVAWALCQRACNSERVTPSFREFLLDSVTLTALGLIADVVPLKHENRVFVRHGLHRLQKAPSIGLKALLESSGLAAKAPLRADDVSYKLAPRLNAAGRLGPARLVVDLLTTASAERAGELVRHLEVHNQQRQQLERRILAEARAQVAAAGFEEAPALVLASADWHPGVIGIVAGRLVELYGRPALLIALKSGPSREARPGEVSQEPQTIGQGSGRSVPGLPLHEALGECSELLQSHGGHAAAAGLKIRPGNIPAFRDCFCAAVARRFPEGLPSPSLIIDAELPLAALTLGLVRELDRLEPFGSDNRRPLFLAGGLQVVDPPRRLGGGDRHLSFRVRQGGLALRAVAFNMADRLDELMSEGGQCCLVFTPRINCWQEYRSVELEVIDLQPGPMARLM